MISSRSPSVRSRTVPRPYPPNDMQQPPGGNRRRPTPRAEVRRDGQREMTSNVVSPRKKTEGDGRQLTPEQAAAAGGRGSRVGADRPERVVEVVHQECSQVGAERGDDRAAVRGSG